MDSRRPAYGAPVGGAQPPQPWSTGLGDCFEDGSDCCVTWCCPCITFGRNAEIIDKNATTCGEAGGIYYCLALFGLAACYTCTYRTKLRAYLNLSEDPCNDCLVHCCCLPCALCQESRELKNRGIDPSLGWMPNAEKWNKIAAAGTTNPPSFQSGMSR